MSQFSVGKVTLENLRLKPEALADLNLPVAVAAGCVEKLALSIPWMNLHSNPTKVHINGLYILVVPKNESDQDLTEHHANKMRRVLQKVENLRRIMLGKLNNIEKSTHSIMIILTKLENKKLDEKEMTFFERKRLQIMQNIEITAENLHISYETNSTTKLGHPFSFGITIHSIKLNTDNDRKTRNKNKDRTSIIYILKELNSLSIYWNVKCTSRINMPFNTVIDDLKSKIAAAYCRAKHFDMNYILYPTNMDVNMIIIITDGEHNFDRSTFNIDIKIGQLALNIDSKQFSDLLDFAKFQNYSTLYDRCREYRQLYLQESTDNTLLNQEQKERLKILESKLDAFNLAYIRHSVEIEIEQRSTTGSPHEDTHKNKYHRWNSWWRKRPKLNNDEACASATTSESHRDDGYSFYFEDLSNIIFNISMHKLDLYLLSPLSRNNNNCLTELSDKEHRDRDVITYVSINDGNINLTKCSISSSLLLEIHVPDLRLYAWEENLDEIRLLVKPTINTPSPLMNLQFELFPINKCKSDYRFHLNVQPISIIYDAVMFNRIAEYFEYNVKSNSFSSSEIKHRTHTQMEHDLSCAKIFDMHIVLNEISIIFPDYGFYKELYIYINIVFYSLEYCSSDFRNSSLISIDCKALVLKSCVDEDQLHLKVNMIISLLKY
ncbi:unnamed protein product [Rotaria socialis]|uniref:Chorein N-terminal domain-containing protein n=1 Tax=Rotaria socialis TaxID=392032 RepID=A0A819B0T0_9BILA|nr:unnamed protein product [Rotaria socialis]